MTDARPQDAAPQPAHYTRRTFIRHGVHAGALLAGTGVLTDALAPSIAAARGVRHAGAARGSAQPNILVIVVDQMRAPRWFGAAGYVTQLPPNLARLRQAGVSFARHYTASNDCSPARSALLTGLHTHQTGCLITGASTLQPAFDTWGSMLREQGYATYWYGKWHLTRGDHHWTEHDGPSALERYGFAGGTYPSPNGSPGQGLRADGHIADQFVNWFGESAGAGPWCTTVSFVNPHDIAWWYRWTNRTAGESTAPPLIPSLPPNFETPAQLVARHKPLVQLSLQETTDRAFGSVLYSGRDLLPKWLPFLDLYVQLQRAVDTHIGRVLDTLTSRPEIAANTVVVFTSDHGEYGASHGLRGKGAGCYEEGINIPLIVADFRGTLNGAPALERSQLTSSVDVAPLLLTIASGSNEWRHDPRYAHLAARLDLAAILADPAAPGRRYALHATDEDVTEFALEPYAADAPRHVVGLLTPSAKYARYAQWRGDSIAPLPHGQESELYDYTTRAGRLEIDSIAGRSAAEAGLRAMLDEAAAQELHAPLPERLHEAQRSGFSDYFKTARKAALRAAADRRRRELAASADGRLVGGLAGPRRGLL